MLCTVIKIFRKVIYAKYIAEHIMHDNVPFTGEPTAIEARAKNLPGVTFIGKGPSGRPPNVL